MFSQSFSDERLGILSIFKLLKRGWKVSFQECKNQYSFYSCGLRRLCGLVCVFCYFDIMKVSGYWALYWVVGTALMFLNFSQDTSCLSIVGKWH